MPNTRRAINRRTTQPATAPKPPRERKPSQRAANNEARARRRLASWQRKLIFAAGKVAQLAKSVRRYDRLADKGA
jgi:hypothetical protein